MKNIRFFKGTAIFLILTIFFSIGAFAVEVKEEATYTLEELTNLAIKNSPALKSAELKKEANFDTLDNVGSMTAFVPAAGLANNDVSSVSIYKLYKNYDIAYALSKKTLELEKDKIRNNTIGYFYGIQNLQKEIEYSKKDLDYQKNNMDILKLKYNMGLISNLEKNSGERQYFIAKDSYALLISEYNKTFKNLNTLVGLSSDSRYSLVYEDISNIEEKILEVDSDYFVNKALANNIIIEMSEKSLELKKLNVDYYAYNDPSNFKTYSGTKTEYAAEVSSFTTTKDGVEKFVRETFYSVQEIQDNYNKLLAKHNMEKDLHEIKKIQYDLGMITKMDLADSENTLLENEANLAALKSGFNQTIFVLNYPHVQLG